MTKLYNSGNMGENVITKYAKNMKIGKGSTYNDRCYFNARFGITIGENTIMGPNVLIQTSNHVIKNINTVQNAIGPGSWCGIDRNKRIIGESVTIGDDCWIGANVIILPGVIIPDKCIIGAGTIITKKNCKNFNKGDIIVIDIKLKKLGNRIDYE